jgi:hypothetical protein
VVVDATTGVPVSGARVAVIGPDGTVRSNLFVQDDGTFAVTDVAPGMYTLRVTAPCSPSTYDVTVEVPRQTYIVLPVECPAVPPPVQAPPVQLPVDNGQAGGPF